MGSATTVWMVAIAAVALRIRLRVFKARRLHVLSASAVLLALLTHLGSAWATGSAARVVVSCALGDTLAEVDPVSFRLLRQRTVCRNPGALGADPEGRWLVVAQGLAGGFWVVDPREMVGITPVREPEPQEIASLAFSPDGARLFALSSSAEALLELHVPSWKLLRLMPLGVSGGRDLSLSPEGRWLYVGHRDSGTVSVVDLAPWQLVGQRRLAPRVGGIAAISGGRRLLVALPLTQEVGVFEAETLEQVSSIRSGQGPAEVEVARDGRRAVVVNEAGGSITLFDPDRPASHQPIGVGSGPRGVALSPDGRWAFVANRDSHDLSVVDLEGARQLGRLAVGRGPQAVTWVP